MKKNGDIIEFIKQKDYIMINNDLGKGSFGKAVLLQDPFINELFVAKKYEPESPEIQEQFYQLFLQEIKILHKLNHRNIVRIFNYYAYENNFTAYIIMEYINGQNIDDYFSECIAWELPVKPDDIFAQLIEGFRYIEEKSIIHRDIREGNILIDTNGTVKIIDFGLGKISKLVVCSKDSLVNEINRLGLDKLPNEYGDGTYNSQTDIFYLAELFNRLLKKHDLQSRFSYQNILDKMMEADRQNRYTSFAEIKTTIEKKVFSSLKTSESDKRIYQDFSIAILNGIGCYIKERKFNYSVDNFINKIESVLADNRWEYIIRNNNKLINSMIQATKGYI